MRSQPPPPPASRPAAGKIFDFNLTLPLMAGQFLILMVVLDKLVYKPVGAVLDARDSELRTKLEAVKDNAGDLLKYTVRGRGRPAAPEGRVSLLPRVDGGGRHHPLSARRRGG